VIIGLIFARNNRLPDLRVPTPVMPSGNTYREFVSIGDVAGKMKSPSPYSKPKTAYTAAEFAACAKEARPLLSRLKTALKGPYLHPPARSANAFGFPENARFREAARLLAGVATHYQVEKEYGEAADALLDGIEMGVMLPKGGALIEELVGSACIAITGSRLEGLLPNLPAPSLRASIARISELRAKLVPYQEIVQEEKYSSTAVHLEWMREPRSLNSYYAAVKELLSWTQTTPTASAAWQAKLKDAFDTMKFALADKRAMLLHNQRCYDEVARESTQPFRGQSKVPLPQNPFAIGIELVANHGRRSYVHTIAAIDLMLLEAALLLYRAEQGQYPDALPQLAPRYLPAIPTDPFGGGQFGYVKKGRRSFTLYSIGADLRHIPKANPKP